MEATEMHGPYCMCGCGKQTSQITYTNKKRGHFKGEYRKYIHGHNPIHTKEDRVKAFYSKLAAPNENGCLQWTGYKNAYGYGRASIMGKTTMAHRWAWILKNGPIPNGLHVLHHCDNPPCCNIDHLFLGTDLDNSKDRDAKGRTHVFYGEEHPIAKLTLEDVLAMRKHYKEAENTKGLYAMYARRYGVWQSTIQRAIDGKSWRHIDKGRMDT